MPVSPPKVNKKRNPTLQIIGASQETRDREIVAIHLKILIPVGTPIIMVAAVKYARVSTSIPTVNMWCAHTKNPKMPIEIIA